MQCLIEGIRTAVFHDRTLCRIVRQGSKIFLKLQSASKTPRLSGKGILLALWSIFWIRVYGWEFYELYWDALRANENKSVVFHRLVQKIYRRSQSEMEHANKEVSLQATLTVRTRILVVMITLT